MSVAAESAWTRRAVCFLETSAAPELWTSDRRPRTVLFNELKRMCDRCPVRVRCATGAVMHGDSQAGIYAGVYLPQDITANTAARAAALDELRSIAGLPAEEDLSDLGVPA